ncbi:MAG: hypothetical protein HY074_11655 [Deltaproteobacteria bacterium]|nr:hypothetical protein [Deltaproteobacteria bacterium]
MNASNEQMAAQMAQFTSLEQMVNMNNNLEKLTASQQPLQNMGAANLIGKYVTADSSRLTHTEGKYTPLNFELPQDAAKVHISIINEKGETVRELDKTNIKKGQVSIDWDGKISGNLLAKSGQYMMQVSAVNEEDKQMQARTQHTEVVHGVAFEGKETVLLTGDLTKPTKMLLRNVSRIIDASAGKAGAAPSMVTGPGGLEVGGLENLVNQHLQQQQAQGAGAPPVEIPEERNVEGGVRDRANFAPLNIDMLKKVNEQPAARPAALSNDEIRKMVERPDLSAANAAAEAVQEGRPLQKGKPAVVSDVNPAALERGYTNSAAGKSVPSGVEGSTAGKWGQ